MKIAVLVSGGVDSSVALKLLKNQGHDVTAFYVKIWLEDNVKHLGDCGWQEDIDYVKAVCNQAAIPLKIISLHNEYWQEVVTYTIAEVKAGRTPNPDSMCNKRIKFGEFFKKIGRNFDKVASGHYAQVEEKHGRYYLKMTPDTVKDQTYFLSQLTQKQLKQIIFPLAGLTKDDVRKLAKKYDLPTKDRKDSQGICFLGKIKYKDFVKAYLGEKKGNIIEYETGKMLGEHNGFWFHTIGQREGMGLAHGPWYVVKKDITKNIIYVSHHYQKLQKERKEFKIGKCNWIPDRPIKNKLKVKIRHGPGVHYCTIKFNGLMKTKAEVILREQDQGIASGQFAVFYDGKYCIGGGIIE